MVSHIDDFLHCGDDFFNKEVIEGLCKRFQAGSRQDEDFKYVGYQITQTPRGVTLSQKDYVENVEVPEVAAPREVSRK